MKIRFLIIAFLLFAVVFPAAADSVWTPMDDYFMETWDPSSDNTCGAESRPFYMAAGERGYVTAVQTPLNQMELKNYPNGTEFKIAFICGRGDDLWGAVQAVRLNGETTFTEDWNGQSGYIAMSDLIRSYDSQAFQELNCNSIFGAYDELFDFCSAEEIVLWSYPNSGVQLEYLDKEYMEYLCMDFGPDSDYRMYHYGPYYVEPDGNIWIEVTLRQVTEGGWFSPNRLTEGGIKPEY